MLVALTFWTRDAEGKTLSDSMKSQVMLWRRSSQGRLPISGLFESITHSGDPDERAWVEAVLANQNSWKEFAQEQYDSLESALYMKTPQEMISSDQWGYLVDHLPPTEPAAKDTVLDSDELGDCPRPKGALINGDRSKELEENADSRSVMVERLEAEQGILIPNGKKSEDHPQLEKGERIKEGPNDAEEGAESPSTTDEPWDPEK